MKNLQSTKTEGIFKAGQLVPVVAFYSVSGGVGKSTLARKFAELITVAPGREGRKPNVLIVDLDVESSGITFRLAQAMHQNLRFKTVHEVLAERTVVGIQAKDVTSAVSLASGNPQHRGQLYLMPAAPPDAKGLFDTIASIGKEELYTILKDLIHSIVMQYDISCVVIDCAPGANPYTAAAATLANVPFLIGRNEPATYEQIRVLPERFLEWYDQFQPANQKVIINAVSVKQTYNLMAQQYAVFDYIPLTTEVILETEGLLRTGSMQMLLFEKYVVDIIKQVFVGMNHLIPESPEIVGQEWMDVINKLERCEEATIVRRLRQLRHLRWIGTGLVVTAITLIGIHQLFENTPAIFINGGIIGAIAGVILATSGWYAESKRQRILIMANKLIIGGPDEVLRKLKEGPSNRRELEEMKKLSNTIPTEKQQSQPYTSRGAGTRQE